MFGPPIAKYISALVWPHLTVENASCACRVFSYRLMKTLIQFIVMGFLLWAMQSNHCSFCIMLSNTHKHECTSRCLSFLNPLKRNRSQIHKSTHASCQTSSLWSSAVRIPGGDWWLLNRLLCDWCLCCELGWFAAACQLDPFYIRTTTNLPGISCTLCVCISVCVRAHIWIRDRV